MLQILITSNKQIHCNNNVIAIIIKQQQQQQ